MIKHRGWAMTMGRVACGKRPGIGQLATNETTVTCRACMRIMVREALDAVGAARADLLNAENELSSLREHRRKLNAKR